VEEGKYVQKKENRRKKQVWKFNFLPDFAALVAKKYPSMMEKILILFY
jgi:hypothetical protein